MAVTRFMRKGTTKFFLVPTLSTYPASAHGDWSAATDLTGQIATVTGFDFKNVPIKVPDMSTAFVSQIGGEDDTTDSSFEFYELKGGTDTIKAAQTKGLVCFIGIFNTGIAGSVPAAAEVCDIWPVVCTARANIYSAGNEAAKYRVNYAVTAAPAIAVVLS
jgi:hypothetical protein